METDQAPIRKRARWTSRLLGALAVAVVALTAASLLPSTTEASGPTALGRTPWQVMPIADYIDGVPNYGSHGHISYYSHLPAYPAADHVNWADCGPSSPLRESPYAPTAPLCPDPATIGMVVGSRLPGCMTNVDFTLFQTFVDIPFGTTLSTFTISLSGMDDGARITIFNSTYPSGLVIPGSYVYLGGSGTSNLASYVAAGETNRVVITQVDDCAVGNNLQRAEVNLNGTVIPPTPTVAPVITSPTDGAVLTAYGHTVSGLGQPGTYANLLIDGVPNGQWGLVGPDGTWEIVGVAWPFWPRPLAGYDVSAALSGNIGGILGPASNVVHVTNYPPPPVILTPLTGTVVEEGGFAVSGTGLPGLEVHIHFNGLFNAQFTTVEPDGTWSIGSVFGYEFLADPGFVLTATQRLPQIAWGFDENHSAPSNAVELSLPLPVLCAPGTYNPTGFEPCLPAPAGSYVDTEGATAATLCAPGTYQPDAGQTSCVPAPAGSYVATEGATAATLCAPGTYQPDAGQTSCIPAPAGSYVDVAGAAEATLCAPGTYQPDSGQTSCIPAPAGSYVDVAGAAEATLCAPGTYQPDAGQTSCLDAPVDTFVATAGAIAFTACPPGTSTNGLTAQESCALGYAFPVGGVFVVGNGATLTEGASVTFWSSQWTRNNPTSSKAPSGIASFKGFAGGTVAPACGGLWTASPGNSGNPPALIPEYMAVVVTSTITSSKGNVQGDVQAILIVKTNAGYGGAPGHAGTGTVVGVLCSS